MKRLVWLQHVPVEGLGYIANWANGQGFTAQAVRLYAGDPLAQLIAEVLGARVYPNAEKEIGWFPIHRLRDTEVDWLPEEATVFHWHGDTFDLPEGAERLCSSEGCLNQAFVYQERIIGLQFHLETTAESARTRVENGGHERVDGPYIQDAERLLAVNGYQSINQIMENLLTSMTR